MAGIYQASLLALQMIVGVATGISLIHFITLLLVRLLDRRPVATPATAAGGDLRYVFMVPALNEEAVIGASVRRLLAVPGDAFVLVIDDGSTDRTAGIVLELGEENDRVELLQRVAPNARQGKGEALNHAYRKIVQDCQAEGIDPESIVLCVMDADGLLDMQVLTAVDDLFRRPEIGAVQIGVRVRNRETMLGLLQDIEFFTHVRLVQQGRNHLGSAGLGGNGQFTRLSAMMSLGPAPWTACLTEDLDLGIQLILKRWKLAFTDRAYVHQEGLVSIPKLVRQRSRWVQGYFQCWRRIPEIMVLPGRWYTVVDLLFSLVWPAVSCLLLPAAIVLCWVVVVYNVATTELPLLTWLTLGLVGYALAFSTSAILAFSYRARSGDISVVRTILLIHSIGLFQFVWGLAGWRAFWRVLRKQGSWAKTERVAPAPVIPG